MGSAIFMCGTTQKNVWNHTGKSCGSLYFPFLPIAAYWTTLNL